METRSQNVSTDVHYLRSYIGNIFYSVNKFSFNLIIGCFVSCTVMVSICVVDNKPGYTTRKLCHSNNLTVTNCSITIECEYINSTIRKENTILFHRRGYAEAEIEAVFAKYDLDGDRILDEGEQKRMQADLEGQKVH